jgi:maleate cis-trans isomerase
MAARPPRSAMDRPSTATLPPVSRRKAVRRRSPPQVPLVHALRTLGTAKIAFASPYVPAINDLAIDFLTKMEIETVARADIGTALSNEGQGALTPGDVMSPRTARRPHRRCRPSSCPAPTCARSNRVADVEARLGKPVVTSNQAMLFQALQLLQMRRARARLRPTCWRCPAHDHLTTSPPSRSTHSTFPTPRSTPPRRC